MLDFLPQHKQKIFLTDPIIKKYIAGRLKKAKVIEYIEQQAPELMKQGLTKEDLLALVKADSDAAITRKAGVARFNRFLRKMGLAYSTPADRVVFIKNISAEKFLDILAVGNGLLRGKGRFERFTKPKGKVHIGFALTKDFSDVEPPASAHSLFTQVFKLMQEKITVQTLPVWAAKLYFAIIFAHMFTDGNGRIARGAYYLLRTKGILNEKAAERGPIITDVCMRVNVQSIQNLFARDSIPLARKEQVYDYAADEKEEKAEDVIAAGYTAHLKYLAARRMLMRRGQWTEEKKKIAGKSWEPALLDEFHIQYERILDEWFWEVFTVVDQYQQFCIQNLDQALLIEA